MSKKIKLSEPELLCALLHRQRIGAAALYDMYAVNLYRVIYRIIRQQETSEDVLQIVLMKIWDAISQYQPDKGRLFTWMKTIAYNSAITAIRTKSYAREASNADISEVSMEVDKLHFTSLNVDAFCIRELLQLLRSDQRVLLELLYFQGYTHSEAAEHLGIPLGTVKTRWSVGIKTLRHLISIRPAAA